MGEQEPEPEPQEPLPERRVPYSLHIVSHFPHHKHLHEESAARKAIEKKIVDSFHSFEDIIRHVEVNLQVSENFHRDKAVAHKLQVEPAASGSEVVEMADPGVGSKVLTPYIFKVTVSLKNQRTIVLANAEKHAQPTLTEGLDHMVDVIKKSLREEKDKDIEVRRKEKYDLDFESLGEVATELEAAEANAIVEELEAEADKKMDELYKKIEVGKD